MAALVQTIPSQTTSPMMSGRPSSSGGYNNSGSQQLSFRNAHMSRYNPQPASGYRGMPATGPVAPYAFTSTPQLANNFHMGHAPRSASTSMVPPHQPLAPTQPKTKHSGAPSLNLDFSKTPSLDLDLPISSNISLHTTTTARPSPDRYRRNVRRVDSSDSAPQRLPNSALPSGSGMAAVGQLYNHPAHSTSSPSLGQYQSYRGSTFVSPGQGHKTSADDMLVGRSQNADFAARYRRRSLGSIDTAGLMHEGDVPDAASPHPNSFLPKQSLPAPAAIPTQPQRPTPSHTHSGSAESVASSRSGRSSRPSSAQKNSSTNVNTTPVMQQAHVSHIVKQDSRFLSTPSRPNEPPKRNPSPLSRPVDVDRSEEPPPSRKQNQPSAAAERLAAVSQKLDKKKSKSKLRRAFSFGSTAELRKATAEANMEKNNAGRSAKRGSKYEDELEPEQARIAEKQEAAGLGESIYSGQGHFFSGSTDNVSISSTASSASVMLRKMGKGVKKGARSISGLFRPKSVVGVPAADGPVNEAAAAQVSLVTVEAEREKVNVNLDPHEQPGGGTGFPKLERNSIDTNLTADSGTNSSDQRSRRSIVGGEKERAEVLAAVKKGILKRTDSDKPSPRLNTLTLPQIPNINDSPRSSAPSTPADDPPRSGHRRTDSIAIEGNEHDDYFASVTRFASIDSKSATPFAPPSIARNISFSPRIQFHDTWPSGEYDRRGDIATCNRLTPMLAQQIKEELNTFKMEMEVHESSKVYTHFF